MYEHQKIIIKIAGSVHAPSTADTTTTRKLWMCSILDIGEYWAYEMQTLWIRAFELLTPQDSIWERAVQSRDCAYSRFLCNILPRPSLIHTTLGYAGIKALALAYFIHPNNTRKWWNISTRITAPLSSVLPNSESVLRCIGHNIIQMQKRARCNIISREWQKWTSVT